MVAPPQVPMEFTELPEDSKARHEALVDAFGYMLFSLRNQGHQRIASLVSSREAREQVGKLFRDTYEEAAKLGPAEQKVALELANSSIDLVTRLFLTMLAGTGVDQKFGTGHAVSFRLHMEIKDVDTGNIVAEETINRDGNKFFPDYWGRWLNQFGTK